MNLKEAYSQQEYEIVIGLEVHVQLATQSKIFSNCPLEFGRGANYNTDPLTLALPGTLPVINAKVVQQAVLLGLASNCSINQFNQFARKHYFYPDLPKGYQISQFEEPICENGFLELEECETLKKIRIKRIHMEEDAGKSTHSKLSSLIDLNRAGTPLLEVVSEPDLRSPQEAVSYLKQLYQLVTYLGICDGNMEEGNFRCDANISIRPQGSQELGTRTEIKNLNSFKFVEKALSYEAKRQIALVSNGEVVVQATLLFDSDKAITKVMRSKEEAADYRYFPDPDLPPLHLSSEFIDSIKAVMPELPIAKKKRFMEDLALSAYDATVLTANKEIADFFEECLKHYSQPKLVCNWITSELFGILKFKNLTLAQSNITPDKLGILLKLLNDDVINANSAKLVLTKLIENGGDPRAIIQQKGLAQTSSKTELLAIVQKIFADNPQQLQEYQAGKENLLGFFVGQVMKATQGKANPKLLNELIRDEAKKN